MIKFFRKIRQRLLKEGKVTRYLTYALGEIVLVVIGILIALQINNWNEDRKQATAEEEFYLGVKNDLQQDLEFINYVQANAQPKIDAYDLLNSRYSRDYKNNKVQIDSLLSIYLFYGQRTFYPVSGSFKSAVAGNQINTYVQKDLVQRIIKLYNSNYDRIIDNGKIVDDRWSKLSEKYIHYRRTNSFDNINNTVYIELLDDFHFHYIQLNWYNKILDETESELNELLKKLS
jgi:hypothetical protein